LFGVSRAGTLAYVPGDRGTMRSLAWVDRDGREELLNAPPRQYQSARVSPDGALIALEVYDAARANADIWIWDNRRGRLTPVTSHPAVDAASNNRCK
jgi:hypothetical protein